MKVKFPRRQPVGATAAGPEKPKASEFEAPPRRVTAPPARLYSLQLSRPYSADRR